MFYRSLYTTTIYDGYVTVLEALVSLAVALSILITIDRISHVFKYVYLKLKSRLFGKKPESKWRFQPFPDAVQYPQLYPKVAVQLPMFNERAVCQSIIDHSCSLDWPRSRLTIQVLDDSTDKTTRDLVDDKVMEWNERGIDVVCIRRTNRHGYKAGALKDGLKLLNGCDYIAVFDADFKPETDFLTKLVPYLHLNDSIGYVQARWTFTNPEESYLTKAQEISLNYHMKCEQWVHFASGSFFNFNGTAGVWRKRAIEEVGGWNGRTTVEDMDLSLRTYIAGWRAIFVEDVCCPNEIPSSYFAYRKQQHRWTCGPVQLWRRTGTSIWTSKLPWIRKMELYFLYFILRKTSTHFVALGFFCFLVPLSVYTPEVSIPLWALVYFPLTVTLTTAFFTSKGWRYCIVHVLCENSMSVVKLWAVFNGLFDLGRAHEWVVTAKAGSSAKGSRFSLASLRSVRVYATECILGLFSLAAAVHSVMFVQRWTFAIFLTLQGLVFLAFGLSLVDSGAMLGRPLRNYSLLSCLSCGKWNKKEIQTVSNTSAKSGDNSQPKDPNTNKEVAVLPISEKVC